MTRIQPVRLHRKIFARFFLLLAVGLPMMLCATGPAWWTEQGVLTSGATADDYAAINQGQLKLLVTKAAAALDAHLPNGAGTTLHNLVGAWSTPTANTDDYAAVNLGQLKAVAQPIYDQLIAAGVTTAYPWTGAATPADDYALANIGQVKNLFSFDLSGFTPGTGNGTGNVGGATMPGDDNDLGATPAYVVSGLTDSAGSAIPGVVELPASAGPTVSGSAPNALQVYTPFSQSL